MSKSNDDAAERNRVFQKIASIIMDFYRANIGKAFHAEDLRRYVLRYAPEIAPDSPGRILRLLRQGGKLNYVVISRRDSIYQFR